MSLIHYIYNHSLRAFDLKFNNAGEGSESSA